MASPPSIDRLRGRPALLAALGFILAAVVACYHGTLHYPYLNWDDYGLIRDNLFIRDLSLKGLRELLNPYVTGSVKVVRDLSWAIDYRFWKSDTTGYHLGNLVLYVTACTLLFVFFRRLLQGFLPALVAVLLFALHPLHVEAVTWLSARKEPLSTTFFMLAFLIYTAPRPPGVDRRARTVVLTFVFYVLAMFSKETTVVLPVLLGLYEAAFGVGLADRRRFLKACRPLLVFLVTGLVFTALVIQISSQINVLKPLHGGSLFTNILSALLGPPTGLRMLAFPASLSARYSNYLLGDLFNYAAVLAILCCLGLLVIAADLWNRNRILSFAILWYFITLAPVSNLIPISTQVADRYLFLPSVGFCLAAGQLFGALYGRSLRRRSRVGEGIVLTAAAAVLFWFGSATYRRNLIWKDNLTLWNSVIEQDPNNILGHLALGNVAREAGDIQKAFLEFQRTLWFNPNISEARQALGDIYLERGDFDKAIEHYNKAMTGTTQDVALHLKLGEYFEERSQYAYALEHFEAAAKMDSLNPRVLTGITDTFARGGRLDRALESYASLCSLKVTPIDPRVHRNLGLACYKAGQYQDALKWFGKSVHDDSLNADTYVGIGRTWNRLGDQVRAEKEFRHALSLRADCVEAMANIAEIRRSEGKDDQAIEEYRKILTVSPKNGGIKSNLAMLYFQDGNTIECIRLLRDVMAEDTTLVAGPVNLASVYLRKGRNREALQCLETAVRRFPDEPGVSFNLAWTHAVLGEMEPARMSFMRALSLGFQDDREIGDFLKLETVRRDGRFEKLWKQFHASKSVG